MLDKNSKYKESVRGVGVKDTKGNTDLVKNVDVGEIVYVKDGSTNRLKEHLENQNKKI